MNRAQLTASRKLWRTREVSRFKKWHFYRYQSKRPLAERTALTAKWLKLYVEARDARRNRDRQIAKLSGSFHQVSDAGVALVAQFEGFRADAYRDPVGVLTQGYGETQGVTPGKPWTEAYAKARLKERLNRDYVPAVIAANKKLDQNEGNGFTSFVYNVGVGGVSAQTQVGQLLRRNKVRAAADALLAWCKAGGRVLPGLLARRKRERSVIIH